MHFCFSEVSERRTGNWLDCEGGTSCPVSSMTLHCIGTMWRVNCSLANKTYLKMDIRFELPAMSLHCLLLGCTCHCVFNKEFLCLVSFCISCTLNCNVPYCLHNKTPSQNVTKLSDSAVISINLKRKKKVLKDT